MLATRSIASALLALAATAASGVAAEVDYAREVKAVLAARCGACHGALKQESDLRVDTAASLIAGGLSGPAVEPGSAATSELILRITSADADRMPPPEEGAPLTAEEIAAIRQWIDAGAPAPPDEVGEADPRDHWAFKPPQRPAVPTVADPAWVRNPIDAFIAADRDAHGLAPQSPADKRLLLRRVHLDLVGLPPTREQLAAFDADQSPDAYERVVDRLLASPQYGERWGRHWMDVWRYSDWWGLGAELRNSQKHIWHWRDWIIESLNADVPYDEMVRQMIAGDELYPADVDKLRATGYLARSYFLFNRTTWMDEVVEHTSKGFLGLTMNCCKCHDHKYDPLAQTDYYRLRAFFEPYQVRTDKVPGQLDVQIDGVPRVFDCNLDAATYLHERGNEAMPRTDEPLSPGLPEILGGDQLAIEPIELPPAATSPGLQPWVLEDELRAAEARIVAAAAALDAAQAELAAHEQAMSAPPPTTTPAVPTPTVADDFAAANPALWQTVAGDWFYENGKLLQRFAGGLRSELALVSPPPENFEAKLRVAITGGEPHRSISIGFDVGGDREVLAFITAQTGDARVALAYKHNGQHVYPAEARQPRAIALNQPYEITVRVVGPLVNVAIDGEHAIAYRLPEGRAPGALHLITYTATVALDDFALASLPAETKLVEPGAPGDAPVVLEHLQAKKSRAELALAAAKPQPAWFRARAAADRAKSYAPPASDAAELARAAALLEKQVAAAQAADALALAELELLQASADARPAATAKRDAAKTALDAAATALQSPGDAYTPLVGAVKARESNAETDASYARPYPVASTGRRTALARWMSDRANPLAARVAVNHVWARHFGRPLVASVFDFGRKGAAPTHPALLDWLAVELMDSRWSLKHLHRLMVTSATYRMTTSAAGAPEACLAADAENRRYWRMNPTRMEAQIVRDSLLHMTGELDPAIGGPSIPIADEASRRRSLYFVHSSNEQQTFLGVWDDASVRECYRRDESIVPQQALALSNSKLAIAAAKKLAKQLGKEHGATDAQFIAAAFTTILASSPTPAELAECERSLQQLSQPVGEQTPEKAAKRARVTLIHALLNHNDFVTIR